MDLQNIFGLLRKIFVDPLISLGFCNSFLDLSNFSILKKIFRFEICFGICKIFLDCPFSASVNPL